MQTTEPNSINTAQERLMRMVDFREDFKEDRGIRLRDRARAGLKEDFRLVVEGLILKICLVRHLVGEPGVEV
jgi:hypothetical protein